ncbi:methionine synthase [Mycobacterium intermedium]|uniref:Methionine synthase n=1 Tax=Mycobacterium intermedium TaxID=28445 RepID=A0A1E3S8J0_MYCIE|nr:methionine synthase [Mycobacterium intermedium]MCV6967974.1 methionine synthase [Mycobacterium intermedium]ODQ97897.1 methionine synthase [Mycobacterium intermedium]OPE48706.1 methionine synthase [Mycobacterium intermedium]ORA97795.1 methionine synthase [Mycobacterium intermedium]
MNASASPFARATGIGSWPGTAARPAAEVVVGELAGSLAHLVELPARGVGADLLGRAGALLVDLAIDTVPRGYRLVARPGAVTRRAVSLLDEDMDALEEAWETAGLRGGGRVVKVQAPGPITLAAGLELANGHRAITDLGAVRDLAASLAEGVATHRAALARRLDTPVVVQYDEPTLPAALGGRLTGVTALSPIAPLDESVAEALFETCVGAAGAPVMLHSCAAELPWDLLQRTGISAVSVDAGTLRAEDLDQVAAFVDSGRTVVLGVIAATRGPQPPPTAEEVAVSVVAVTDRLGFGRAVLRDRVGVTPACGLAGATAQWARTAIGLAHKAAELIAQDPDAI